MDCYICVGKIDDVWYFMHDITSDKYDARIVEGIYNTLIDRRIISSVEERIIVYEVKSCKVYPIIIENDEAEQYTISSHKLEHALLGRRLKIPFIINCDDSGYTIDNDVSDETIQCKKFTIENYCVITSRKSIPSKSTFLLATGPLK